MFLKIRHRTQHCYAAPVRENMMEVWKQPQKNARQRLAAFDLSIDPAAHVFSYADSFGNAVHHFDVPRAHSQLTILSTAAVETSPGPDLPGALDGEEWNRLRSDLVAGECFDFLRPTTLTNPGPALAGFAAGRGFDGLRQNDPLTAVRALMATIHGSLAYDPEPADVERSFDRALEHACGACQDFAHIMIAVCRQWGVPARYVSGYLFTGREDKGRSDPDASHAWVEVYLPSLRWVGFDPTNAIEVGERHVSVAVGRDYADVPPSRGVYKGEVDSELHVAVSVTRAGQDAMEPEPALSGRRKAAPAPRRPRDAPYREFQLRQQQQQQQ